MNWMRWTPVLAALLLTPLHPLAAGAADAASEAAWQQLRQGGYVILIRHALTDPGVGDPPGFRLDDCDTQRNLSEAGRADARRIGEAFKARAIPVAEVRSSRWCRCLETARLAFGAVTPDPMLDSMFGEGEQAGSKKLRAVRAAIAQAPQQGNLVLVTHNQNIMALTERSVSSGEMVVIRPDPGSGALKVIATLPPGSL
jgi:broad specificity phosphatase PhoE